MIVHIRSQISVKEEKSAMEREYITPQVFFCVLISYIQMKMPTLAGLENSRMFTLHMPMPREGVLYTVFQGNHAGGKGNSFTTFIFVTTRADKIDL